MKDFYGKCGCNCGTCPAYIGNARTEADRQACSDGWKKYLNISLKAEKCTCLGCQAKEPWKTGNIIPDRACLIRKCAEKSELKTCAHCGSFPCSFVEERSKLDYSRPWVEKRVGEKISEETYHTFVQTYETYNNLQRIRSGLGEADIQLQQPVAPLKVKVAEFPPALKLPEKDLMNLRSAYDLMLDLLQCRTSDYINQILNERRIKPALVMLWVFAQYGRLEDDAKLVIESEAFGDKKEFDSIVRKRDNYWHGSAEQAVILLSGFGLKTEFAKRPCKAWTIILSYSGEIEGNPIAGLKLAAEKLVLKHDAPEYVASWKYKGEAFKCFEKLDFNLS